VLAHVFDDGVGALVDVGGRVPEQQVPGGLQPILPAVAGEPRAQPQL